MVYTLNVTHRINEPSVDGTKWRVDVDNSILERLDPSKDVEVEVKNARVCFVGKKSLDQRLHGPVQITSNSIAPNYHKNAIGKVEYVLQKPVTLLPGHYSQARAYYGPILQRSKRVGAEFYNQSNVNDALAKLEDLYTQVTNHSEMTEAEITAHELEEHILRVWSHYMDPNNTNRFEDDLAGPTADSYEYYYTAINHLKIHAYNNKLDKFYVDGDLFSKKKWQINYVNNVSLDSLYPNGLTGNDDYVINDSEVASESGFATPDFTFHPTPFSIKALPVDGTGTTENLKTVSVTVDNGKYNLHLDNIRHLIAGGYDPHDAWKSKTDVYPFTSGMELWLKDKNSDSTFKWLGQVSPKNWEAGGPFHGNDWGYGKGAADDQTTTISKKDYIIRPGDLNFEREPLSLETYNLIIDDTSTNSTYDVDGSGNHPFPSKFPAVADSSHATFAALENVQAVQILILPGFEYGRMKRKLYKTSKDALDHSNKLLKDKIKTAVADLEIPEIKVSRDNRAVIANCDIATPGYASLGHELHQRESTKFSCAPPRWGTMEFGLRQTFEPEDFWKYNNVGAVEVSFDLCFY